MSLESRARLSVGIDGRQYARKTTVYVDVLGLPTITEAVQEASRMLRRGIVRAMSCSTAEDTATSLKVDKNHKSQPLQRSASQHSQPAQAAPRDLVSVYSSAITKNDRKPNSDNADPARKPPEPSNAQQPRSKSNLRSWNSAKKAGPSILSKRARPPTNASPTERVFQPATKRERKPDASTTTNPALVKDNSIPKSSPNSLSNDSRPSSKPPVPSEPKPSTSVLPSPPPPTPTPTPTQAQVHSERPATGAGRPPLNKPSITTAVNTANASVRTSRPNGNSAGGLPAAWSQVSSKSTKPPLSSPTSSGSLLMKKPVTAAGASTLNAVQRHTPQKRPLGSSISPLQAKVKKSNIVPIMPRPSPIATGGAAEGIIPTPSATGIQVKYVPGSTTINGVRPNGYTVSSEGVVKPVVSFSPKPKLPHKLRQTSVEKLFEGWRDTKKFPEADALSLSLRTEQEIYAEASGRTDYRAAVTVKLKELRR